MQISDWIPALITGGFLLVGFGLIGYVVYRMIAG